MFVYHKVKKSVKKPKVEDAPQFSAAAVAATVSQAKAMQVQKTTLTTFYNISTNVLQKQENMVMLNFLAVLLSFLFVRN